MIGFIETNIKYIWYKKTYTKPLVFPIKSTNFVQIKYKNRYGKNKISLLQHWVDAEFYERNQKRVLYSRHF